MKRESSQKKQFRNTVMCWNQQSLNRMMRLHTFYWESKIRLTFIMQCLLEISFMMLSSTANRWLILQPSIAQVMEIQKGIAVVNIFLDSTRKIRLRLLSRLCFTLAQMNGMGRCHSMRWWRLKIRIFWTLCRTIRFIWSTLQSWVRRTWEDSLQVWER